MADSKFTTFCGWLDELEGMGPESDVRSSVMVAQVWRGCELIAECLDHEWAERVAAALNTTPTQEPQDA